MQVEMENLGLVLIIQTKNFKALEIILKVYPQFFLDYTDDILGGVLLCTLKHWH